jgi:hypothetical protein
MLLDPITSYVQLPVSTNKNHMIQTKGIQFSQNSLKPDLEGANAGQSTLTRATLTLVLVFFSFH